MRALGFSALVVLSAATALGAASTHGNLTAAGLDRRVVRQLLHRSTAVVGLVLLVLHLVCAVIDTYVPVPLGGVLLPFTAAYRVVAMAIGTMALYAFVLTAVSGITRGALAALPGTDRAWRAVHASAYVGWALAMLHGFFGGSDTRKPWAIALYAACTVAVGAALLLRLAVAPRRSLDQRGHRRLKLPRTTGALR
jgi:sulfoxide reductase heme-binding subunit YedZ